MQAVFPLSVRLVTSCRIHRKPLPEVGLTCYLIGHSVSPLLRAYNIKTEVRSLVDFPLNKQLQGWGQVKGDPPDAGPMAANFWESSHSQMLFSHEEAVASNPKVSIRMPNHETQINVSQRAEGCPLIVFYRTLVVFCRIVWHRIATLGLHLKR